MRGMALAIAAALVAVSVFMISTGSAGETLPSGLQTATPTPTPSPSNTCKDAWRQIDSDEDKSGNALEGVAAISGGTAWAVGHGSTRRGQPIPLIKRWDGTHWDRTPVEGRFFLHDVDAGKSGPVWAVGEGSSGSTLSSYALRRAPGGWRRTAIVHPSPTLTAINDVSALSKRHVWATGNYWDSSAQHRTLIEHWNGRRWKVAPVHKVGLLDDVFARGADDVWVVGRTVRNNTAVTLTMRFDGDRWRHIPSPSTGEGPHYLYGVAASGRNEAWAVGERTPDQGRRTLPLLMKWDGDRWLNVNPDLPDRGNAVLRAVSVFNKEVVAVGSYWTPTTSPELLVLTRRVEGGGWERADLSRLDDDDLYDVEHAPNGAVYAAGYRSTRGGSETALYRPPLCP